jgi:hypothetical protein
MVFIDSVYADFEADARIIRYSSGAISTDCRVAQFFLTLQEKEASIGDVQSHTMLGKKVDFQTDWSEAERILKTFFK